MVCAQHSRKIQLAACVLRDKMYMRTYIANCNGHDTTRDNYFTSLLQTEVRSTARHQRTMIAIWCQLFLYFLIKKAVPQIFYYIWWGSLFLGIEKINFLKEFSFACQSEELKCLFTIEHDDQYVRLKTGLWKSFIACWAVPTTCTQTSNGKKTG